MASRLGFRAAQQTFRQPSVRVNIQNNFRHGQRRAQSTATAPSESGFAKFWNSPVGPKTVHFWAPIMKWGLVIAGTADFARPVESLSLSQNLALASTGLIWTRWCFVIRPRNIFLASVNFLVFCVGATQATRVIRYQASLKGDTVLDEAKATAKQAGKELEKAVEDPKSIAR